MFHHHILSRNDNELIKKVYTKQKEDSIKGDWFQTLKNDFKFIGEEINDQKIMKMTKTEYQNYIQVKIEAASFQYYLSLKEKSKKKMHELKYDKLRTQDYLTSSQFSQKEINLLFALRSKSYPAKMNFKKMNRGNPKCGFHCYEDETQLHIFENCEPLKKKINLKINMKLENIYGTIEQQKKAISIFLRIDTARKDM